MTLIGTALDWAHLAIVASVLCLSTIGQYILLAFNALFPFPTALEQLHRRSRPLQRVADKTVMRDQASPEFIGSRNCVPMAVTTENPPAHGGQGSSINGSCLFSLFQANLGMRTARIEGRRTARELVEAEGFGLEDHHAVTPDGFVLVMHRIVNSDRTPSDAARDKPVVLLMHGLMQDSESLLCGGRDHSLGLRLAAAGFDVFLGNARGNRYSHKHMRMSPQTSDAYWNFSIDELARFDTPTMVEHALKVSRQTKLCYIGFSQGTAQAFAAFSSNADLLDKIFLFVALSPAARANHLSPSLLLSLVQANLRFLYLILGRRRMLPVALTWQRIMSRGFFIATIDVAVEYLFSWKSTQVSAERKFELYPHIYSYTSVKCVVHWFQMMYSGRLSMFADSPAAQYIPVTYDVRQISCPVAIFYGGNDHLVEVETLKSTLPNVVMSTRVEDYEHLDTMWADTAKDKVFPKVEALVKEFYPATNGNSSGR